MSDKRKQKREEAKEIMGVNEFYEDRREKRMARKKAAAPPPGIPRSSSYVPPSPPRSPINLNPDPDFRSRYTGVLDSVPSKYRV